MIGYKKTLCTKVIQTEHEIGFKKGTDAGQIKLYLSKVPDDAILTKAELDDDEVILVFRNERTS